MKLTSLMVTFNITASMSVISKHFYEITAGKTCQDIVHPWTPNCLEAVKWTFLNTLSSNLKFFFPLIFVSNFK